MKEHDYAILTNYGTRFRVELQSLIRQSFGFLYMDQIHRLVFLNENLSDCGKTDRSCS